MATKNAKNQKNKIVKTKSRQVISESKNSSKGIDKGLQAQSILNERIFSGALFLIEQKAKERAKKIVEFSKPNQLLFDLPDIILEASMKKNPTRKDRAILHLSQFCEYAINVAEQAASRKHAKSMSKINR
jgi:hypothetical protein